MHLLFTINENYVSVLETCIRSILRFPCEEGYVRDCEWLLHEAFCLYSEADIFKPYEKHHSTVKEACELAESLHIPSLVLWHTEDKRPACRKELYTAEGRQYYSGNLFVPDDREIIPL